jgi:ATP:ADP antiporter, AAA family
MTSRMQTFWRGGPPARVALWGAATFAAMLAATFIIRPVRDALALGGKPELLPVLFTATFVVVTVVSPAWGWVIGRFPRRRFVPFAHHAFAAAFLAFAVLVTLDLDQLALGRVFYVFAAVANLFLVSLFWSVCADVLGPDTARSLYGPIAVGGTIGAVVGPLLAKLVVGELELGISGVLVGAAILLELALLTFGRMVAAARALADTADATADDRVIAGREADGLASVVTSPYLGGIGLYVVFTACAGTFVYMEQASIVNAALPTREASAEYFATVDLYTNLAALVLQSVIAGPLLRWFGVGLVIAILPLAQAVGIGALLAAPTLTTLMVVQIATRAAQHGLTRPGREMLFTVVSREEKYRAKNVIDTLLYRFGDVGSAWLHLGLVSAGLGGMSLLFVSLPMAAVWVGTSVLLDLGFRRRRRRLSAGTTSASA